MIPLCRLQSVLTGQFPEGQKASWASLGLEAGGGFSWLNIHVSSQPGGAWQLHLLLLFQDPWLWGLGAGGGKTALGMRGSPPSHAEANHNERKSKGAKWKLRSQRDCSGYGTRSLCPYCLAVSIFIWNHDPSISVPPWRKEKSDF